MQSINVKGIESILMTHQQNMKYESPVASSKQDSYVSNGVGTDNSMIDHSEIRNDHEKFVKMHQNGPDVLPSGIFKIPSDPNGFYTTAGPNEVAARFGMPRVKESCNI